MAGAQRVVVDHVHVRVPALAQFAAFLEAQHFGGFAGDAMHRFRQRVHAAVPGELAEQEGGGVCVRELAHMRAGVAEHRHHVRQAHVVPLVLQRAAESPEIPHLLAFGRDEAIHVHLHRILASRIRQLLQVAVVLQVEIRELAGAHGVQDARRLAEAAGFLRLRHQLFPRRRVLQRRHAGRDVRQLHQLAPARRAQERLLRQAEEGAGRPRVADGGDAPPGLVVAAEEFRPARYAAIALAASAAGEQHLAAEFGAALEHVPLHLVAGAHVRRHLVQAAAPAGVHHGLLNGRGFPGIGPGAWGQAAVRHAVAEKAGGGEAHRAALHGFLHQIDDVREFLVVRLHAFVAAFVAHRLEADGGVADEADHVQRWPQRLHAVQILAEGRPVPGQAVHDGVRGDVLHRLHQLGQIAPVALGAGREGDAAVADQRCGHAVVGTRPHLRLPADLRVQVGVQIDEARRHQLASGVDGGAGLFAGQIADAADAAAIDGDVGAFGVRAGTVDDGAAGDDRLVRHGLSLP